MAKIFYLISSPGFLSVRVCGRGGGADPGPRRHELHRHPDRQRDGVPRTAPGAENIYYPQKYFNNFLNLLILSMSTAISPPATAWWARTWWSRSRTSGCRGISTPRTTTACRPSRWCRCAGCRQRASSSASSRPSPTCGHTASCSGRSTATACR